MVPAERNPLSPEEASEVGTSQRWWSRRVTYQPPWHGTGGALDMCLTAEVAHSRPGL